MPRKTGARFHRRADLLLTALGIGAMTAVLLVCGIASLPTGPSARPPGRFASLEPTEAAEPDLAPAPQWHSVATTSAPSSRWSVPLAYDAADHVVVASGGWTGTASLYDTWTFSNGSWTNITSHLSVEPPALDRMVYDPQIRAIVAYGSPSGYSVTWEFQNLTWKNVTPSVAPSPRGWTMMTYDASRQAVILFGGSNSAETVSYNDTWQFKSGAWTNITPSLSPPARARGMLAWDARDGADVLFGGFGLYGQPDYNDTWEFENGAWTHVSRPVAPSPRDAAVMVYDPNDNAVVVFGGFYTISGGYQGTDSDTWEFAGGVWTLLSPATTRARWP